MFYLNLSIWGNPHGHTIKRWSYWCGLSKKQQQGMQQQQQHQKKKLNNVMMKSLGVMCMLYWKTKIIQSNHIIFLIISWYFYYLFWLVFLICWRTDTFSNFCFFMMRQIESMLQWVCAVTDHKGCENVLRVSVTPSCAWHVPLFCLYYILMSSGLWSISEHTHIW